MLCRTAFSWAWNVADWRPVPSQMRVSARSPASVCASAMTLGAMAFSALL